MSVPAETPAEVTTRPASTQRRARSQRTSGGETDTTQSKARRLVVASRPERTPALPQQRGPGADGGQYLDGSGARRDESEQGLASILDAGSGPARHDQHRKRRAPVEVVVGEDARSTAHRDWREVPGYRDDLEGAWVVGIRPGPFGDDERLDGAEGVERLEPREQEHADGSRGDAGRHGGSLAVEQMPRNRELPPDRPGGRRRSSRLTPGTVATRSASNASPARGGARRSVTGFLPCAGLAVRARTRRGRGDHDVVQRHNGRAVRRGRHGGAAR